MKDLNISNSDDNTNTTQQRKQAKKKVAGQQQQLLALEPCYSIAVLARKRKALRKHFLNGNWFD